jgi:glycerophosphoryl diester phosphodiesterase
MELADLDALDFASWKNPWADLDDEAPDPDPERGGVLTLRKLMEVVADYDRTVEMAIETKHPTRYTGLVERRLVELLDDFGWDRPGSPARVMSFSYSALQRVRRMAPAVPVVMLIEKAHHWPMLKTVVGDDWILGPGVKELRDHPKFARRLVRSGHDLHVWTVNTPEELRLCLDLGVKAVISDRPAYLLELLGG